jgi:hypothetical protein
MAKFLKQEKQSVMALPFVLTFIEDFGVLYVDPSGTSKYRYPLAHCDVDGLTCTPVARQRVCKQVPANTDSW